MTRAEYYRARAKEAEQLAQEVQEEQVKQAFREIAREWRHLADQVERQGC
jgi:hypothetical protein